MKKLLIPPVFVLLSLILIVGFYFFIPKFNIISFPFNLSGLAITMVGFAFTGKSHEALTKHKTTLFIEKSSNMVTQGIYSKTRNPMYVGMFLLLLGIAICFGNLFSLITPLGFLLIIQFSFIPKEEKLMFDVFGQEYLDYKAKVRMWI